MKHYQWMFCKIAYQNIVICHLTNSANNFMKDIIENYKGRLCYSSFMSYQEIMSIVTRNNFDINSYYSSYDRSFIEGDIMYKFECFICDNLKIKDIVTLSKLKKLYQEFKIKETYNILKGSS